MATLSQSSCKQQDLWVPQLDNRVTESELFEFFNQVAPVLAVDIRRLQHIETADAFGTITFPNKKDAILARDSLHTKCIHGKPLSIMLAVDEGISNTNGCANVFVKNLDATIDSEYLRKVFSICGTILSCKVATDNMGRSKGYGYVQFEEEKDAKSAILNLNEIILRKKEIYVRPFINKQVRDEIKEEKLRKTVFVKNVSEDVGYDLFVSIFRRSGRVRFADTKGGLFDLSRDDGFVTFEIEEEAARAVKELNGYLHNGKTWHVKQAWSEKLESRMKQGIGRVTNLYVKNIDKSVDDEKLEELFFKFGRITSCNVMLDSQGLSKGFGFVAFSSCEEASKAVKEMNGKMISSNPKRLYVAVAQRKEERKLMLQARFARAPYQENVAEVPLGTSVSAPPYPAGQFQFGYALGLAPGLMIPYQFGTNGWGGEYPQLMPPIELLQYHANEGYMSNAR
ncbi:hypothetical protein ACHQM5_027035 [Ranunculus cassubicifolius]